MLRNFLALTLITLTVPALAQEGPTARPKSDRMEPTLKMGDPAPALKITKWLKGDPVPRFEKGKVYVIEFWATWCGPCIASMPHLTDLQELYRDKGLQIIAVTTKDLNNTEQEAAEFVKTRGGVMGYTVGFSDDMSVVSSFLQASGKGTIPCSFVVDQQGKIAYIGHPANLDDVLPRVLGGTWRGQADVEEIQKTDRQLQAVFDLLEKDPALALARFLAFEEQHPSRKSALTDRKLIFLMKAGKLDEARRVFDELYQKAVTRKDASRLSALGTYWGHEELNPKKHEVHLAVKAARASLELHGEKDTGALLGLANAYYAAGDKEKAREYAGKALATTDDPSFKRFIEHAMERFNK